VVKQGEGRQNIPRCLIKQCDMGGVEIRLHAFLILVALEDKGECLASRPGDLTLQWKTDCLDTEANPVLRGTESRASSLWGGK